MNLLIVEDNDQMRRLLRSIVQNIAENIYECRDGAEALQAYRQHRPDWVLMDVRMKEIDGISATRQLKAAFPAVNVLIVSEYDDADLHEAAREAGASAYVSKENLLEVVRILTARETGNTTRQVTEV